MTPDWNSVEAALVAWVKAASGYSDGRVVWSEQTGNQLSVDFITMRLNTLAPIGQPVIDQDYDSNRPAGSQLELNYTRYCEATLTVQAFTTATRGSACARAILERVQAAVATETTRVGLDAVGVSVFDEGQVQTLTDLEETKFRGRAVLDVRLYIADVASELTSYIEAAQVTDTTT